MPVTLNTAAHAARKWKEYQGPATSREDLFQRSCGQEFKKSKRIIQTSLTQRLFDDGHISASQNGFLWAAVHAYSNHHHLTIRPEEVWFSILSQLSYYINAHAEELRDHFVAHEGQKELETIDVGTIDTVDFGYIANKFTYLIQQNVKDPELQKFIIPNWTTTTDVDRTVASILMMGSMQKYFTYRSTLMCGIPSVTLLGVRADWEDMLKRLDKLPELGAETAMFATLLRPILRHFIASFDPEPSPAVLDFWSRIAHEQHGSGMHYISGWITAFCFWGEKGQCLLGSSLKPPYTAQSRNHAGCELDEVFYHSLDTKDIPYGFASVPLTVNDNGTIYKTRMLAGLLGIQVTSSGNMTDAASRHSDDSDRRVNRNRNRSPHHWPGYTKWVPEEPTEQPGLDSVQPLAGWIMYETKEQ